MKTLVFHTEKLEVTMTFDYRGNHYAINCDWLQYSVFLGTAEPIINCPDGYRIDLCQGNNIYEKRALVMDSNGRKRLTLLWKPYSSVLNPYVMTVQVANDGLYTNQILSSLDLMKKITWCQFNSIGRIDLCCDFDMTTKRFQMLKHLNSGHYYVERKTQGSTFWHEIEKSDYKKKTCHCMSWGSKTSEIKVKLYNKTRELGIGTSHEPEKPWIISEWDKIGIDKLNAWRLEFSLHSNGMLRYQDRQINLDDLANNYWLACVFIDLYYTRFVTRINQGKVKGHKNKDERVFLLDLPTNAEKIYWAQSLNQQSESMPAIKLLRSMLANLANEALVANKELFENYSHTIIDVVTTHHLEDYFENRFGVNAIDYLNAEAARAGSGINETIASPSKFLS